ncbi:hypothetical protein [Ornithinimicrobium murale]|uniref:hypothetical protein n=1 Tax=Ornithinimicrobium murale TaxID=1050153 RepID=UPI000E0D294B|nr:hypothetical protein [Ornithinimicrobium murale]
MAGKGKAAGRLIKYGPIAVTAAQRWGPVVWEQVKNQREPAEKFVQDKVAKGNQRKKAMAHAATVIDGSVLQVFHLNTAHWVVFSGDDPIAVHPPAQASFEELLDRADLGKRVRPAESSVTIKVPRPRRRARGATAWVPREEPASGPHTADSPVAPGRVLRGELSDGPDEQPS